MPRRDAVSFNLDRIDTPIGEALVVIDCDGAVRAFDWADHEARMLRLLKRHYGTAALPPAGTAPEPVREAIARYFGGEFGALDDVPFATEGTAFQLTVWSALRKIPAGETRSYGELAARIGSPTAVRAVGLANGSNPIGLIVPCHRVIGASGALTGYGGGIERKAWLLKHEGAIS